MHLRPRLRAREVEAEVSIRAWAVLISVAVTFYAIGSVLAYRRANKIVRAELERWRTVLDRIQRGGP